MKTKIHSTHKKVSTIVIVSVCILIVLSFSFFTLLNISPVINAKTTGFVPTMPAGPTKGYITIVYTYDIITMNKNSSWMFDWGDGTTSEWVNLSNDQTSISKTHAWASSGVYQVRVMFKDERLYEGVWSNPLTVNISSYSLSDLPHKPGLVSGKIQGVCNCSYIYTAQTTDPHDCLLCYRFDWGNQAYSDWTTFTSSGSSSSASHIWAKPGEFSLRMQAKNQYGLESQWSDPVHLVMKNTSAANDSVSIDLVAFGGVSHHIVFSSNRNGTFYNSTSGLSNAVGWSGSNVLIDSGNDGHWDYIYSPANGLIQPYVQKVIPQQSILSQIPWLYIIIIVGIIVGIIVTIIVLIKTGIIYTYEEVVVEK